MAQGAKLSGRDLRLPDRTLLNVKGSAGGGPSFSCKREEAKETKIDVLYEYFQLPPLPS